MIEALDDELLVYDRTNKRAHCLSTIAARVWQACDGSTDLSAISADLGVPVDVVREARDELEASRLLEQRLELVKVAPDGDDGKAVTRRELAARSAKVGTAVATAPLILSITAPTAMAAATPTPFQCQTYTTHDCGTSAGCGAISGCCCCCQGSLGSCKVCSATSFCQAGMQPCPVTIVGLGGVSHCSSIGSGGTPSLQGCCGIAGSSNCGCAFAPAGTAGTGGRGGGAGCCNQHSGTACTPGMDPNCVPCCNGKILLQGSAFGCCTTPTDTCITRPPA